MTDQEAERRHLPQVKATHALAADTEAQTLVDRLADELAEEPEVPSG